MHPTILTIQRKLELFRCDDAPAVSTDIWNIVLSAAIVEAAAQGKWDMVDLLRELKEERE